MYAKKKLSHNNQYGYCRKCIHKQDFYKEKVTQGIRNFVKSGKHHGWNGRNVRSFPEIFFERVLKNNKLINFKPDFPIRKTELGLQESGSYLLDFYFPEKKLDLEIDGSQHFYNEKQKASDIKRDDYLTRNGYCVYRIRWNNINTKKGKKEIKEKIDNFINFYHIGQ